MPYNIYNNPAVINQGQTQSGDTEQVVNITDLICEGPIKGLVKEEAGLYLNDSPAIDADFQGSYSKNDVSSGILSTITFDGSTSVGTNSEGLGLSSTIDVENRAIQIEDYQKATVGVSFVPSGLLNLSVVTINWPNGSFDAADWNTINKANRRAVLKASGYELSGSFTVQNATTGTFVYYGDLSDSGFNISKQHTLNIAQTFFLESVAENGQSVTLKNNAVPTAGTYNFKLLTAGLVESGTYIPGSWGSYKKVDKLNIQFVDGSLYQNSLAEVNGVGGTVSISGNPQTINLAELKQLQTQAATSLGVTLIDANGYPESQSSNENGAADLTKLTTVSFGLDSAAKISQVDEVSFTIGYPAFQTLYLKKNRKETAYAYYEMKIFLSDEDGNISANWADGINIFPNYGKYIIHKGNTNAPVAFEHTVGLDQFRPFTNFEIRIARITRHVGLCVRADGTSETFTERDDWQLAAQAQITALGGVIKDKFRYPYSALASVTFSSKKYNGVPKRSYLLEGLKVKIPDTYTPREYSADGSAKYEGFWGGSFKDELYYTDNPAWVFYDIVTNNRYGAGQWIKEADIDKYALYRIAKYCDELVPDGKGGEEPRFRANLYLSKSTDIYKVLKDIASMFTGMLYWLDGQLTIIQDTPADAVYTFSKSNVIDGQFNYESTGTKTRANQVVVTWNDPTINYEPVPLIVEDREDIVRKGKIISQTAVAFGATSEGQAIRYGRWKLWTALNQTEVVSFKTGLAGAYIKPGDIINVQDADRYGISHSGRISSYTPGTLVLDRNVTFNAGSTYTLSTLVTQPAAFYAGYETITIGGTTINRGDRVVEAYVNTGTLEALNTKEVASNAYQDPERTKPLEVTWKEYTYVQSQVVTNPATTTNTLSIITDVAVEPQTIWALTEQSNSLTAEDSVKKYKVLSLSKDSQIEYSISAVEYYDAKFDAVDTDYELGQIPSSIYTEVEPEQVPAPRNIYVVLETDAKNPGEELRVEWDAPEDFDYISGYELVHTVEGMDSPIVVNSTSYSFTGLPNDLYTFRVRTVSTKGNKSRYLSVNYNVSDPFENNVTRLQEGIPAGIRASSTLVVNSNNQLGFEVDPTTVVSVGDEITTARTIDSDDNISLVGVQSTPNVDYSVILLGSTIELAYYESAALENLDYWKRIPDGGTYLSSQSNNWSNITGSVSVPARSNLVTGIGTSWKTSLSPRDIILFGSATDLVPYAITAVQNGKFKFRAPTGNLFTAKSRVRIDGTSGSTELNGNYYYINNITSTEVIVGDETVGFDYTLSLYSDPSAGANSVSVAAWTSGGTIRNSPPAAKVISIISDTEILIDRSFEKRIPSSTPIKKRWGLSPSAHSIFGSIKYSSQTQDFEIKKNIILDPSLVISRFLSISTSVPSLQYEQVSGVVSQIQAPTSLSITVNPIGFKDPVFKVTAVSAGLEGATLDTEWQDPTSGFQYTKEIDIDGQVPYDSGTPEEPKAGQAEQVTVLVAEKYNTSDYIEDYGFFVKLKDGAIGIDGKTVRLTADDYSVIYDSQGESPSFTGSAAPTPETDITLTATANFENPLYRFTEAGGTPGNWSTTATYRYTVPLTFPDWANKTRVFEVEAADTPSGWDEISQTPTPSLQASDSLTIAAVKSGAGGVAVVNSNSTHSYSTDADGNITTNTIPNSGTTLELLIGGSVGTYVGATSVAAFGPPDTPLSNGQWYISAVSDTDTDISAGSIIGVSNNIVIIGPVTVSQPDPVIDDNESVTWTITYKSEGQEQSITTTQTLSKSKAGTDGTSLVADLTNETHSIPADFNGDNPNLTGATSTLQIFENGSNTVDSWTITTTASSGISFDGNNTKTVTVTGMAVDEGTITFVATKASLSVTAVFTLTKVRAGEDGDDAIVYRVISSASVIQANSANTTHNPPTITFTAQKIVGNAAAITSTEGTLELFRNGSLARTDNSGNRVISDYEIPDGTTSLSVVYTVGGVVVDEETIPVVFDGINADALTVSTDTSVVGQTTFNFSDGTSATIFDGAEGDTKGVVAIFASDASGNNQSFTQGSLKYVNYYEYTNTKPSLPVLGLTWVKYVGEDGDDQGVKPIYADSAQGLNATFIYNNQQYVNFYEWSVTAPTTVPAGLTYVKFVGSNGTPGPTGFFYILQNNTSTPTSDTIPAGTYTAGQIAIVQNNNGAQAGFRYNGSSWQAQNIVNKDIIFANAIDAEQLRISNTTGGASATGIYMNGTDNRIEIWDSGVARVKLGNLA